MPVRDRISGGVYLGRPFAFGGYGPYRAGAYKTFNALEGLSSTSGFEGSPRPNLSSVQTSAWV